MSKLVDKNVWCDQCNGEGGHDYLVNEDSGSGVTAWYQCCTCGGSGKRMVQVPRPPNPKIKTIKTYRCEGCYKTFDTKELAKKHATEELHFK